MILICVNPNVRCEKCPLNIPRKCETNQIYLLYVFYDFSPIVGVWGAYCMSCVILALNRCIEIHSYRRAEILFGGRRIWYWLTAIVVYGLIFSSSLDIPPIYNSEYSVFFFQIDLSPGSTPVTDYLCFCNSCWVVTAMIIIYTTLIVQMRRQTKKYGANSTKMTKTQKKVGPIDNMRGS